jgi:hypothetical protein
LAGGVDELARFLVAFGAVFGLDWPADFLDFAALEDVFPVDFFTPAFFLAGACRLTAFFTVARRAGLVFGPFRADFAGALCRAALRLAIASVLSEP